MDSARYGAHDAALAKAGLKAGMTHAVVGLDETGHPYIRALARTGGELYPLATGYRNRHIVALSFFGY